MIFGARWSPKFPAIAPQNAGLERESYLQPRTQSVVRGGTFQRTRIWQRLGSHHNIAQELLLPRTHAVARETFPTHSQLL